ncbi:MAG: RNA polymerase sigma factor, partial [Fimbriimonadales bacterium]
RQKGLSEADAEDCAAEVRLQLLCRLQQGATLSDSYFLAVLRGGYADFVASRAEQPACISLDNVKSVEGGGEADLLRILQVRSALEQLIEADRELLLLHYEEGYTLEELSARFACSPECLRQRLHRARQRLKRLLE